jgi:dCMP deaminase
MKVKDIEPYTTRAEFEAASLEKWDARFMQVAELIGTWSSCYQPNRQVGAVIARDKRVLTTGYNGAGSGITSCVDKEECLRRIRNIPSGTHQEICYAVHAEQNAIIQAAKIGLSVDGGTLYCTHQPCVICAKMIINSGIRRVVYRDGYPDEFSVILFKESGVELVQWAPKAAKKK